MFNFKKVTYSILVFAADHIDAPTVSGTQSDITDFYAFQSPSNSSKVYY